MHPPMPRISALVRRDSPDGSLCRAIHVRSQVVESFFSSAERHFDNSSVYKGRKRQADRAAIDADGKEANNW